MANKTRICLILAGICFLVYANSFHSAFISDDIPGILENPQLSKFYLSWLDPSNLVNSFSYLSAKYNPFPYHAASVILHCLNTILVFFFLHLFFKAGPSFLGACLFAVHPVHAEAVTWISARPYLFLAFFILVTYLLYYYATAPVSSGKEITPLARLSRYSLSLIAFSYFIIKSYSFFALFPLLLVLSDFALGRWRKSWICWLPFFGILLLRLILAYGLITQRVSYIKDLTGVSYVRNPVSYMIHSLAMHFWLLVWPAKLTLYHGLAVPARALYNYGIFYLFAIISLFIFTYKKSKEIFLALGIFIIFLAPSYSPVLVSSTVIAERYLYWPLVALSISVAFIYERLPARYINSKKYLLSLLAALIVVYALRTVLRNQDWQDPERFWQKAVMLTPDNQAVYIGLADVYLRQAKIKQAAEVYEKASKLKNVSGNIKTKPAILQNNLGLIYYELKDNKKAVAALEKAIEINPQYPGAYYNLANIYNAAGNKEEAIVLYQKAIAINPDFSEAYNNLGIAYADIGETQEAIASYEKAAAINPNFIAAYFNLGNACAKISKGRQAIEAYQKVLAIKPDYALAHFNLSGLYFYQGQYGLAVRHYDFAVSLGSKADLEFEKLLKPHRHR